MMDLNLPSTDLADKTDIVHASEMYVGAEFVGTLYVTREDRIFAYLGEIGKPAHAPQAAIEKVAAALGVNAVPGFQAVHRRDAPLSGISVLACY